MTTFTVGGKAVATWDGLDLEVVGYGWMAEASSKEEALAILRRHYYNMVCNVRG